MLGMVQFLALLCAYIAIADGRPSGGGSGGGGAGGGDGGGGEGSDGGGNDADAREDACFTASRDKRVSSILLKPVASCTELFATFMTDVDTNVALAATEENAQQIQAVLMWLTVGVPLAPGQLDVLRVMLRNPAVVPDQIMPELAEFHLGRAEVLRAWLLAPLLASLPKIVLLLRTACRRKICV